MTSNIQYFLAVFMISLGCAKQPQAIASKAESDDKQIVVKQATETPKKKMKLTSFTYRSFQEENSRDSNSQTDIIRFDGALLLFSDKWGGYHPSGGGGEMPPTRYELSPELLDELEEYFRSKELLKTQKEAIDTLDTHITGRRTYRRYGHSLTLEYEGKTTTIGFSYKTGGPRVDAQEANPLNKKLVALKLFLDALPSHKGAAHKAYTKKEVEDQMFFRMNGHSLGEAPTKIPRFYFSKYTGTLGKDTTGKFKHPQFSVNGHGPSLVVAHRQPTKHFRSDCEMNTEANKTFLKLLKKYKLYELKNSLFLSPDMPKFGMKITKYEFNATFRRNWSLKTYLHFYDTPKVRKKDKEGWIPRFEAFDIEFRKLLKSKDCPKIKY